MSERKADVKWQSLGGAGARKVFSAPKASIFEAALSGQTFSPPYACILTPDSNPATPVERSDPPRLLPLNSPCSITERGKSAAYLAPVPVFVLQPHVSD